MEPYLQLSTSQESLSRIRWIAILRGQLSINIAATGGIHTAEDALKALLAGADVAPLVQRTADVWPGASVANQGKNASLDG